MRIFVSVLVFLLASCTAFQAQTKDKKKPDVVKVKDADINAFLNEAKLPYDYNGQFWKVTVLDTYEVGVQRRDDYVHVFAHIYTLTDAAPPHILRTLLEINYAMPQAKVSLSQNNVYLSFETPNRLMDQAELITTLHCVALFMKANEQALLQLQYAEQRTTGISL